MMQSAPPVLPRKHSLIRVLKPPEAISLDHTVNGGQAEKIRAPAVHAEREVELLNHCFDDVERLMARLQQAAEARSVLEQRSKKKSRRKSKKEKNADDLLTQKASPPAEEEFVDIFQKVKYSLSLLDRLKASISHPSSEELIHHVFTPLNLMVKTTGGPSLAASVSSPALTSGAIALLQNTLTEEEKELWMSLGANWTSSHSQLGEAVSPYRPVFLDGWQPALCDAEGQPLEDPVESQQRYETLVQSQQVAETAITQHQPTTEVDGKGLAPDAERLYRCSYDFVARNSSELSVLQGETLEVIESSKRWWKCKNSYDQIGFVPYNILEPLSAIENAEAVQRRQSKKVAIPPPSHRFSYSASSPTEASPPGPDGLSGLPAGEAAGDIGVLNEELMQRLANGRSGSIRPLVIPRATDTSVPLDYHSPPAEVQSWLSGKGFSEETVQSLGILTGAQLFSLNKEELRTVAPEEGVRVYSQITVQKALLEDVRRATELEAVMEKQKMKVDSEMEGGQM